MKKLLLLLVSGSIALSASAQERVMSAPLTPMDAHIDYATVKKIKNERFFGVKKDGTAQKTTATARWYSYTDYFDQHETSLSSSVNYTLPYMWKNNSVLMTFSGPTVDTNNLVSYGIVVDPAYDTGCIGFNDDDFYLGAMKITSADAFTVDSIAFTGAYVVNPAQTTIDTLRVSFVYGTGASSSDIYTNSTTIAAGSVLTNYGPVGGSVKNQRMNFNAGSLKASGSTVYTYDVLLNNSTTPPSWAGDTASNGVYLKTVPVGINVPAGNMIGATVSFLSGATVPAWDTVFFGSPAVPPVKYNMFRAGVVHRGSSTTVSFPTYSAADRNNGVFVDKLTTTFYVPQWFWSSGASAASVQYPDISFRISCAACVTVAPCLVGVEDITRDITAEASPNPAHNELNIPFTLSASATVTVTLSNVLGQVVATQNMGKVTTGKATFNTLSLPAGVYVYNVIADGKRNTGRVVIAH